MVEAVGGFMHQHAGGIGRVVAEIAADGDLAAGVAVVGPLHVGRRTDVKEYLLELHEVRRLGEDHDHALSQPELVRVLDGVRLAQLLVRGVEAAARRRRSGPAATR